jgi:hypothetical protein
MLDYLAIARDEETAAWQQERARLVELPRVDGGNR